MASEPAEPTTRPQDDRVGTVRRLGNSWFVKLVEPASEPWHVVCSDGQQDVSGWQDDESMEDCPVVGYLPVVECVPSLLADPAQATGLQARLDAALAELAKYERSPGCCTACNGVGTVPTGYPCEDCYATGHCHDEAVSCDGMAVDAADPAQTTELRAPWPIAAIGEEPLEPLVSTATTARMRVVQVVAQPSELEEAQRSARFWREQAEGWEHAHQETVLPYTAKVEDERDRLSLLLRGMARKLVATRADRNEARAWADCESGNVNDLTRERDERQARIDRALEWWRQERDADSHWPLSLEDSAKINSLRYRVYAALTGHPLAEQPLPVETDDHSVRTALVGDQPKAEEPTGIKYPEGHIVVEHGEPGPGEPWPDCRHGRPQDQCTECPGLTPPAVEEANDTAGDLP